MSESYSPQKPLVETTLQLIENDIHKAYQRGDAVGYVRAVRSWRNFTWQFKALREDPKYTEASDLLDKAVSTDRALLSAHRGEKESRVQMKRAERAYLLFQELKEKYGLSLKPLNIDAEAKLVTLGTEVELNE